MICICVVNGFFAFFGIFLNSVVIISLWKSSQLRRQTCYFMISVLSCFDLVVVLTGHPKAILSFIGWAFENTTASHFGDIFGHMYVGVQGMAFGALLTVNIDRYLAIVHPFFYRSSVTKRRLLKLAVALELLLFSFLTTTSILNHDNQQQTIFNTTVIIAAVIPMSLMLLMNYSMLSVAKNKRQRTLSATKPVPTQPKGAFTCLLVMACFCMCSSLFIVYSGLVLADLNDIEREDIVVFHLWANTIATMNSSFNSIIFAWRNKILYTEMKKLLNAFKNFAC